MRKINENFETLDKTFERIAYQLMENFTDEKRKEMNGLQIMQTAGKLVDEVISLRGYGIRTINRKI